ncbi:MAG: SAM-dependent methyltransferase [Paludibacter sp.]|nr:SAM-dependent methyltransferase [Paludibacter sp.]
MLHINIKKIIEKLQIAVDNKELVKLQLTGKRDKTSDLKKLIISPIEIKKGYCLNFVYRYNTKDITKNYQISEGLNLITYALSDEFYNAEMITLNEKMNLFILPNGKASMKSISSTIKIPATFTHDKIKERLIELKGSIYLRELGITNADGELRREMSDKYKQINQYIELLAPYLNEIKTTDNLHIADMGSGKGYLTFALYDYLTNKLKLNIRTTGVEFRDDLVTICNLIAQQSNFDQLQFTKGTIVETQLDKIDILIALHACDTATDDAIFRGIMSNAELIVCAPCCHKQIRKAMKVTNELSNITKFGILKERQAEIITDTLRAMIMEYFGYKTNVFEFVSLEHTPKNVMIVGQKVSTTNNAKKQIIDDIAAIKKMYGIEKHYLETLLKV